MIEIFELTKRYRGQAAVDGVSFRARPGRVTAFLGRNGAGKSTTLRILLGLDHAGGGTATIDGRRYRDLPSPLRKVGALIDGAGPLPERRAIDHLSWIARTHGISRARIREVLELTQLGEVGRPRTGKYSLGMRQRLGIAAALLGEPEVLILDEPVNGLDPDGIRWARRLMRDHAATGGTVLVSSHLMGEVADTADDVVVIDHGRIVADGSLAEVTDGHPSLEAAFCSCRCSRR